MHVHLVHVGCIELLLGWLVGSHLLFLLLLM
jgi:hypothetical protein